MTKLREERDRLTVRSSIMRDDRPCERRKTFSSFDHEPFHSGSTSGTIQETQEEEEDDIFQEITSTKVQI